MIRKYIIYNYNILITILITVIILQFIYIVILKSRKKNKKKRIVKIEDFSAIIIPLNQKINTLKMDKEEYKKALSGIEEEIKLYSEQILNMIEIGVLLINNDNIIYKNNWFNINNIKNIKKLIEHSKDNIEKEINSRFFLIKRKKYGITILYTISDITEIKKLEEEILIKEKLAYLGEMSAFIAHEFKNSLTAIKGFAFAIKRKSKSQNLVENISNNIIEEVNYFHKILTDYLNYSKEVKLIKEVVDINSFFNSIIKNIFKENNIKIELSSISISIDKDKMKQVFINLIKNSLEASQSNEPIEIEIKSLKSSIQILIKDYGKGISEENLKKIFNPFFTTKSYGTGLGTSISYQIIKAHGGSLKYEKRVPHGTITVIEIPYI